MQRTRLSELPAQPSAQRFEASVLHMRRSRQWKTLRSVQVMSSFFLFSIRKWSINCNYIRNVHIHIVARGAKDSSNAPWGRICRMRVAKKTNASSTSANEIGASTAGIKNVWPWAWKEKPCRCVILSSSAFIYRQL